MKKIYTDGSSRGNPGNGGWGAILVFDDVVTEIGGREDMTTNNRMELVACIEALSRVEKWSKVTVYSDSEYVIKGMTSWISGWKLNGWKNSSKKEVLNRDLWERLLSVSQDKSVTWLHVNGHSSNVGNNRCDEIATSFADNKPVKLYSGLLPQYSIKGI